MDVQGTRDDEAPKVRKIRRRLMCLFSCLHTCRLKDAVIRKIAFKPPQRHGYTVDDEGRFLINDGKECPIQLSYALDKRGIRYFHTFAPKKGRHRVSILVIHQTIDFDGPEELSPSRAPSKDFLLFSHGNSTDIGYMFFNYIGIAMRHRINIIAYDYSGYGLSDGVVGEKQLYRNIVDVYTYLREELHARPEKIILYGNSIGSAPSSYLASMPDKYPVGGLILEAPVASAIRLQLGLIDKTPRFDAFPNVEYLKNKDLFPTFIIHGTDDCVIPIQHAMELAYIVELRHAALLGTGTTGDSFTASSAEGAYAMLQEEAGSDDDSRQIVLDKHPEDFLRTLWVPGANHNNIQIDHRDTYHRAMSTFFQLCEKWRDSKNN